MCQCHPPIARRDNNGDISIERPTVHTHDFCYLSHTLAHMVTHPRLSPSLQDLEQHHWNEGFRIWATSPDFPEAPAGPLIMVINRLFFHGQLPRMEVFWSTAATEAHHRLRVGQSAVHVGSHGIESRVRKIRDDDCFCYQVCIRKDQPAVVRGGPHSQDPAHWFLRTLIAGAVYAYLDAYSCLSGLHHTTTCGYPGFTKRCGSAKCHTGFGLGSNAFSNDWYVMVLSWLVPECRRLIGDPLLLGEVLIDEPARRALRPVVLPYLHSDLRQASRQSNEGADRLAIMPLHDLYEQTNLREMIELKYYPSRYQQGAEKDGAEGEEHQQGGAEIHG